MKTVIKSAKTVDEAIYIALEELQLKEDEVTVEVLEEPTKKLFGLMGTTLAKVQVSGDKELGYIAKNFLSELIGKMGITSEFEVERKEDEIVIEFLNVADSDKGIIIGKRGETLDSLQYILNLIVNKDREDYIRIVLDIEEYRKKREETLIELAKKLANTVRRNKKTIKLEPMNPYERRIIHYTLRNEKDIKTYSEGEDPYRRVVIQINNKNNNK